MYKFEGGNLSFENGEELVAYTFDRCYLIDSIEIDGAKVGIILHERITLRVNSVGEETVSSDDWIKNHVERFSYETNMFDGV